VFEVARRVAARGGVAALGDAAWRDSIFALTEAVELPMARRDFDNASEVIDRLLLSQVSGLVAGDSAAFVARIATDRVLQAAIDRVDRAGSRVRLLGLN
jgi:hypothetical protein